MTEATDQKESLFLTVLIVVSVFAVIVAFSGTVAAADINRGNSNSDDAWDTAEGEGVVGENATVFQGEADINFTKVGTVVDANPTSFERTAGSSPGENLKLPVPTDQPVGSYSHTQADFDLTVATPRILAFEVRNDQSGNGVDVSGGTATNDSLQVYVEYNYGQAEDIALTVEDSNGVDVTREVSGTTVASAATGIADQPDQTSGVSDSVTMNIDVSDLDEGEYTFTVEGVDDLDSGDASASTTVEVGSTGDSEISLSSDEVTQGNVVDFTVDTSQDGNYHLVTINSSDFDSGITVDDASTIFRNVGDTVEVGVIEDGATDIDGNGGADYVDRDNITAAGTAGSASASGNVGYAYAVVETDDGTANGRIGTEYLDPGEVTVEVYNSSSTINARSGSAAGASANGAIGPISQLTTENAGQDVTDDDSFDVTDDAPTGELTFSDQRIDERTVTVENVSTAQNSTVVLTWTRDGNLYTAGIENADNLDGENVTVTLQMPNAYPGNLTAWVFADENLPAPPLGIGFLTQLENADEVMAPALASETAYVDAPTGRMTFPDQKLSDGTVTVGNVTTDQDSTILVTYFDGGEQVIAGMASADTLDGQNVTVDIQDKGGVPGKHNAWLVADRDLPGDLGIGDDALPVTDSAMDDKSARIETDCQTVVEALTTGSEVTDTDLLRAVRYWRADVPVPGTCGETVSYGDLLDMVEMWRN